MPYFIFKGIDSREFGILAGLPIPPLPERTLFTAEIPGRSEPLNMLDDLRKNIQLPFTLGITDHSKINEINAWLQGYGDLILSNDLTKKYHAYINLGITPERLSRRFGNVPIIFTAEPFRYSVSNPFVSTPMGMSDNSPTGSMTILVNGTAKSEPLWYFSFAGKLRVTVNNSTEPLVIKSNGIYTENYDAATSGGTAKYHYNYIQQNIYVDTVSRLAYIIGSNKIAVTNQTAGRIPLLQPGENTILLELVKEEWEHNDKIYKSYNQKLQYLGYQKRERWY